MHFVFLLYFLFGATFITCKIALNYSPPLFLVGTRMLLAGLLLLGYQCWKEPKTLASGCGLKTAHLYPLVALGFFNIYLTNACEVWGLQYLSSAKTCFIYSLSPFVSALFSFILFSERLSPQKWVGLLIGFLGFTPIMLEQSPLEEMVGSFWGFSWPELAVCIAAVSSVYGWILLKQLVQEQKLSFWMANGCSMAIGGTMALIHSAVSEEWSPLPIQEYGLFLSYSALLIVISNLICYNLYGWLLKRYTATFMSFAGFTTPIFTALMGWFFFSETISLAFCASIVVVFGGLFVFYREELKLNLRPSSESDKIAMFY